MTPPVLSFEGVSRRYGDDGAGRFALRGVTCDVRGGSTVAISGRSGSGKSTFLHLAAGIDLPTEGVIRFLGRDLASLADAERTRLRRDAVGLVFQFFHLLPHLTVRENVALPEWIAGGDAVGYEPRIQQLLDRVGLGDRADDTVEKLSGGEMQRVAICRALVRRPRLLLADEPTGNLDDETGRTVMALLLDLVAEEGSTLIYVTHDAELASAADSHWQLHSGILDAP